MSMVPNHIKLRRSLLMAWPVPILSTFYSVIKINFSSMLSWGLCWNWLLPWLPRLLPVKKLRLDYVAYTLSYPQHIRYISNISFPLFNVVPYLLVNLSSLFDRLSMSWLFTGLSHMMLIFSSTQHEALVPLIDILLLMSDLKYHRDLKNLTKIVDIEISVSFFPN